MNNLTIPAYSEQAAQAVKERLDSLAKVPGSLGKLEELAIRLAGITGRTCPSFPQKSVVLYAADQTDANWETVRAAFVDNWAAEKAK